MTFTINWDKNGVYVKFNGVVIAQDLIDANNYVISNVKFETLDYQVYDFLNIEDFKVTSYDITLIGAMNKSMSEDKGGVKIAILTRNDYVNEIVKEYKQFMEGTSWEVRSFSSVDNLSEWINYK